jgi:hypothetical protein
MTTEVGDTPPATASRARLVANRRNAAKSTGPKSRAGKRKAARNALKHGLAVPVRADPGLVARVDALSRLLAGERSEASRLVLLARRVAEAQVGLERVRAARFALLASGGAGAGASEPPNADRRSAPEFEVGRHVLIRAVPGDKPAGAIGDIAQRLACLDRYEARALSRRRSAIKALDAARCRPA